MGSRYQQDIDMSAENNTHTMLVRAVGNNKRVLELGAASGYMTRVMRGHGCRVTAVEYDQNARAELSEVADRAIIGDLNDPALLAGIDGQFDVVLAGDVLEHLLDPVAVLSASVSRLTPNGRVVISVPNVSHADLKLSLLRGTFNYTETGLLDKTHIRFFTFDTLMELLASAGVVPVKVDRMHIPVFGTELAVPRETVAAEVLAAALQAPESETYQFVVTAVPAGSLADSATFARAVLADQRSAAADRAAKASAREMAAMARVSPDLQQQAVLETLQAQLAGTKQEVSVARQELLAACKAEAAAVRDSDELHHLQAYQAQIASAWGGAAGEPLESVVSRTLTDAAQRTAAVEDVNSHVAELTRRLHLEQAARVSAEERLTMLQHLADRSVFTRSVDTLMPPHSWRRVAAGRVARLLRHG
ncbi:MAG: class I SAM-dependent methyltransferase [Actinomycetota bacterium]|nr:class I SAM-dependent methyltransferase [Actinomycetota bacterium]